MRQSYAYLGWRAVSGVVHAQVAGAQSVSLACSNLLVDVHLFHQEEALLLREASGASTKSNQGEDLVIPNQGSSFFLLVLNIRGTTK